MARSSAATYITQESQKTGPDSDPRTRPTRTQFQVVSTLRADQARWAQNSGLGFAAAAAAAASKAARPVQGPRSSWGVWEAERGPLKPTTKTWVSEQCACCLDSRLDSLSASCPRAHPRKLTHRTCTRPHPRCPSRTAVESPNMIDHSQGDVLDAVSGVDWVSAMLQEDISP